MDKDFVELSKNFSVHEGICVERWTETIIRIKRLEAILIGSAGASILLLLSLVIKLKLCLSCWRCLPQPPMLIPLD